MVSERKVNGLRGLNPTVACSVVEWGHKGSQLLSKSMNTDTEMTEVAFPFCFPTAVFGLPFPLFTWGILCFDLQLQDNKEIIFARPSSLPQFAPRTGGGFKESKLKPNCDFF